VVDKYSRLNKRSQKKHDHRVISYLNQELDEPVSRPEHEHIRRQDVSFHEGIKSEGVSREDVSEQRLPEEVSEAKTRNLREGAVREVKVNAYERNSSARRICIEHYGYQCYVCGFDFEKQYGEIGREFIHVHHEVPLAESKQEQDVDPVDDLKPVCPNCHAIIHRRDPPYSVSEVQEMLQG